MTERNRPRLNITLDETVKDRVKTVADALNVSTSRLVEEVLREFLELYDEDPMIGRTLRKEVAERKRKKSSEKERTEAQEEIVDKLDNLTEF